MSSTSYLKEAFSLTTDEQVKVFNERNMSCIDSQWPRCSPVKWKFTRIFSCICLLVRQYQFKRKASDFINKARFYKETKLFVFNNGTDLKFAMNDVFMDGCYKSLLPAAKELYDANANLARQMEKSK